MKILHRRIVHDWCESVVVDISLYALENTFRMVVVVEIDYIHVATQIVDTPDLVAAIDRVLKIS